jgi:CubicO group peptidase (beta-lactamase class C family)
MAGLRDMARFGEMMRLDGRFNGQQMVPKAVVDDIRRGADKAQFAKAGYALLPGWSYRNMWWVSHNEHGAFSARGVHGQAIYIDPKAEMVIARLRRIHWQPMPTSTRPRCRPSMRWPTT